MREAALIQIAEVMNQALVFRNYKIVLKEHSSTETPVPRNHTAVKKFHLGLKSGSYRKAKMCSFRSPAEAPSSSSLSGHVFLYTHTWLEQHLDTCSSVLTPGYSNIWTHAPLYSHLAIATSGHMLLCTHT
uniref:Uncharacterized protein n=1 Tax=Timema bartmani TaxID=61472 RepID=A0A7R9F6T5_9NEOP|nr:unnamed protein product [Timema bartmani]